MGIVLLALGVAVGLGAFHALEPGHGKTLVAAYLVGSRGTFKHALLLGLIVTAAHTAGVYLLGAVTLYASQYIVPEQLYPWLGLVSGVMILALGVILLVRRYLGKTRSRVMFITVIRIMRWATHIITRTITAMSTSTIITRAKYHCASS